MSSASTVALNGCEYEEQPFEEEPYDDETIDEHQEFQYKGRSYQRKLQQPRSPSVSRRDERPDFDSSQRIATLTFHHAERVGGHPREREVFAHKGFDIGRNDVQYFFGIDDKRISAHHLRFRCVVCEDGGKLDVTPMIYVRVLSPNPVGYIRVACGFDAHKATLSRADGEVLLGDGEILRINNDIRVRLCMEVLSFPKDCLLAEEYNKELQQSSGEYRISGPVIGRGGQAVVLVAVKQGNKRQVACKVAKYPTVLSSKYRHPREDDEAVSRRIQLLREFNILKSISHPNIISLEKVIRGAKNIFIFQELVTGGDLLSYLAKHDALNEAQVVVIVRQLLIAVGYLHDQSIVHRDIKPENVLMTSWRDGARIVLTDFGQSRTITEASGSSNKSTVFRMSTFVGTKGYAAPEVYQQDEGNLRGRGYSKAIDIWSVGSTTAMLLTNEFLFEKGSADISKPEQLDLKVMDAPHWSHISKNAKSFIKGCVIANENIRLTAEQALHHPWLTNTHYASELDAAYQRAIADWKPRTEDALFVEASAATSGSKTGTDYGRRYAEEVKGRSEYMASYAIECKSPYFGKSKRARILDMHTDVLSKCAGTESHDVLVPNTPPDKSNFDEGRFRGFEPCVPSAQAANSADYSIHDFAPPYRPSAMQSNINTADPLAENGGHSALQTQHGDHTPLEPTQHGNHSFSVDSQSMTHRPRHVHLHAESQRLELPNVPTAPFGTDPRRRPRGALNPISANRCPR